MFSRRRTHKCGSQSRTVTKDGLRLTLVRLKPGADPHKPGASKRDRSVLVRRGRVVVNGEECLAGDASFVPAYKSLVLEAKEPATVVIHWK